MSEKENKPLINILTRTSGRPNFFKLCKESVLNQTYNNINHIVCTDDKNSIDYVGKECIFVKRCDCKVPHTITGRRPALHNLYLNRLREEVKEGWIMYLDDDDVLSSPESMQKIVNNITSDDDAILWRVSIGGRMIPNKIPAATPVYTQFSGCGFLYNHKFNIKWGYYTGGDIDFILALWPMLQNKIWIDEVLVSTPRPGNATRKDI